ncbi:MAG: START-like domain-containing protein [Bacteroidales bacterium]|nr:START-like domain-containing protein [Bacteroidales bacterium]
MHEEKFVIDFDMKSVSSNLIWTFISTPNGLAEWFADDVTKDGKTFTFFWNKASQTATLVAIRSGQYVRFRWDDTEIPKSYFELRITNSEITGSRNLQITDFAIDEDEKKEIVELWNNQIKVLKRVIGCS